MARPDASARGGTDKDPWADARVGELHDPLLPRWFVLLAIATVVVASVTTIIAFTGFGADELPVETRRPAPGGELTHDVGAHRIGDTEPQPYDAPCAELSGVQIAGSTSDQALLRQALAGVCNTDLPSDAEDALTIFASAGGIVRFAAFEATGVDSAASAGSTGNRPRILVNARFESSARPRWIAPLIVHDTVVLAGDPSAATTALRAREVEAQVCRALLGTEERSRGCEDADGVLALPDPLAALRQVGYR